MTVTSDRGTPASAEPCRKRRRGRANERGQALIETAITLPLVLFVSIAIIEFGRAYQVQQVLTNAAREGARIAILNGTTAADVQTRVAAYLQAGQVANYAAATVAVNQASTVVVGAGTASASVVTVNLPFSFMVLNPIATLVVGNSTLGGAPLTLVASAVMRNEVQ
jgi:Flp pilus assembly protein TadG